MGKMLTILHSKFSKMSLTTSVLCFVFAFVLNAALSAFWCSYYGFGIPNERFAQCGNGVSPPLWIGYAPILLLAISVYPLTCKLVPLERESS